MNIKKYIGISFVIASLLLSMCACGKQKPKKPKYNDQDLSSSAITQSIAQNEKFEMLWNDEAKNIILKDKATAKEWSLIPAKALNSEGASTALKSALNITVIEGNSGMPITVNGYAGAVQSGRIIAEKTDEGLKVKYCFDEQKIMIPVVYSLRNDSICATVNSAEILECGKFSLISFELAPYLASAQNGEPDSYLFVPSGSGALMYAKETPEDTRSFSGSVYGDDASELKTESTKRNPVLNLPVFAAKESNNALFAIIEKGAESAMVSANSGDAATGLSNIYSAFTVRGADTITPLTVNIDATDSTLISKEMTNTVFSVGYYPLSGETADYNGMAKFYQKYLIGKGELEKSKVSANALSITFYGGVESTKTTLGIPNKQLSALSTVSEVQKIVEDIVAKGTKLSSIRLMGFGESGVLPGKLAGGYKIASKLGSKKDIKALEECCNENGISMYVDYDVVRFKDSGSGFSTSTDAAKSATLRKAEKNYEILPLNQENTEYSYCFLRREKLGKAIDKLIKKADKANISGISLSTLGNTAYSDFKDKEYICKSGMAEEVLKQLSVIRGDGHSVATSNAFGYAAAASDVIYDISLDNGNYNAFDVSIPFYQLIFSGYMSMYSPAANKVVSSQKQLMLSAQCGAGINFSIINDVKITDMEIKTEKLYAMVYDDNIDLIIEQVSAYENVFKKIGGSELVKFEILNESISKSVFGNGTVVYTNNSDKAVNYEGKNISSYGFVLGEEG